jgi:probable HAF family extracellular repeat protein
MRYAKVIQIASATLTLISLGIPIRLIAQEQQHSRHSHYRAIDILPFGGPASYINPESVFGSPNQINTSGTAVGVAATFINAVPVSNGFVCFGPAGTVPFVYHSFKWMNGSVTDLGTLSGPDECSEATSINADGQIAGTSELDEIDPILGIKQIRAVVWEDGNIRSLGTFGGNHSAASAINNRGQIVGFAFNAIPDPFSFSGASTGTQVRAFIWEDGHLHDLGTLGGPDSSAFVLNDRGQVAGVSYVNSQPNPATGVPNVHAFLCRNGHMTDIGSLGGATVAPVALNNHEQLIGTSTTAASEEFPDPFFWEQGRLIDLFTASGGRIVTANAMNDAGQVVGGGDFSSTGGSQFAALLWKNGATTEIGTLPGDCFSEAFAINSRGQVVGHSFACETFEERAFLWEKGTIIDLNAKVPAGFPLQITSAVDINERGEIGGFGSPAGCADAEICGHAFLLIPAGPDNDREETLARTTPVPMLGNKFPSMTAREAAAKFHKRLRHSRSFAGLDGRSSVPRASSAPIN